VVVVSLAIALCLWWTASRTPWVEVVYEFPVGFRGGFVVIDAGPEAPLPSEGAYVIEIPPSGTAFGRISGVNYSDTRSRYSDGTRLDAHAFFTHHVPEVDVAAWLLGRRQRGNQDTLEPWEDWGFVGSWEDADRHRKEYFNKH
jgi:hypothetical protein